MPLPLFPRFPRLLHGGDWNPEQWLHDPAVIDEDFHLFPAAGVNFVSVGIFSWAALEPEEGRYEWAWLDRILDRLHAQGMGFFLATPSGARPRWLGEKHPEIRRVNREGKLEEVGWRHNHCPSAPSYRAQVARIDRDLARRYGRHPGLLGWHVSNELNGECHCPLCKQAFRAWLERRYGGIEQLNRAWWSAFWSHQYDSFAQVDAIDGTVSGLALDWKRFTSDQFADWMRHEVAALRSGGSDAPVTTNLMGEFPPLDYRRLAAACDFVSWDSYPFWHSQPDGEAGVAARAAFNHDLMRCLISDADGHPPWVLMESVPSSTNWLPAGRPKLPGMHRLSSLQALAHGADAIGYFQWRKGRGGCEKHHGAVVDHAGSGTRVFREVGALGRELAAHSPLVGSRVRARIAVIHDWETLWALEHAGMGCPATRNYLDTVAAWHRGLWERGYDLDVIGPDHPLDGYRLVLAPSLYQVREGVAERWASFVAGGGTLLAGWLCAQTDASDLCFTGGFPGAGLRQLFGVWAEELDALPPQVRQELQPRPGFLGGLADPLPVRELAERLHAETAEVVATYAREWYAGGPGLTVRRHGAGEAWYLAAKPEPAGLASLLQSLAARAGVAPVLAAPLPSGLSVQSRQAGGEDFVFVLNFNPVPCRVAVGPGCRRLADGLEVPSALELPGYGAEVLRRRMGG